MANVSFFNSNGSPLRKRKCTLSGLPIRSARFQTEAASAASWFPGMNTQSPVNDFSALRAWRIVLSSTAFSSKTSPHTTIASACLSRASRAISLTVLTRCSCNAAPASPGTFPKRLPSCQSAVWMRVTPIVRPLSYPKRRSNSGRKSGWAMAIKASARARRSLPFMRATPYSVTM